MVTTIDNTEVESSLSTVLTVERSVYSSILTVKGANWKLITVQKISSLPNFLSYARLNIFQGHHTTCCKQKQYHVYDAMFAQFLYSSNK